MALKSSFSRLMLSVVISFALAEGASLPKPAFGDRDVDMVDPTFNDDLVECFCNLPSCENGLCKGKSCQMRVASNGTALAQACSPQQHDELHCLAANNGESVCWCGDEHFCNRGLQVDSAEPIDRPESHDDLTDLPTAEWLSRISDNVNDGQHADDEQIVAQDPLGFLSFLQGGSLWADSHPSQAASENASNGDVNRVQAQPSVIVVPVGQVVIIVAGK